MHTNLTQRSAVRTIAIDAPPSTVMDLVADPRNLPQWAPASARSVHAEGGNWLVDNGKTTTRISVRVSREHGTVDMLAADDPRLGVFTRVLPNGAGSEYQFTMFFPDDVPEAVINRRTAVIEEELRAVRALCERGRADQQ